MDHPDSEHIELHTDSFQYLWQECTHCGCVIGKLADNEGEVKWNKDGS
jgi:hypothetical protein